MIGIVLYLSHRRTASTFGAEAKWSHDMGIRIIRRSRCYAEEAFQEIQNDS